MADQETPVIDYVWSRKFREMEAQLASYYPDCADNLNRHLWYSDIVSGADLDEMKQLRVVCNPEFWDPGADVAALIRDNIDRHFLKWKLDPAATPLRLRKLPSLRQAVNEQMFSTLPVGYKPPLDQYMNDQTIRLSAIEEGRILLQKACYLDQLGTNILCDEKLADGQSFREIDRAGRRKPAPFSESVLANTIGVCGIFVDCEGTPILRYRRQKNTGERMAIMDQGWHCTTSGVLTFEDVFGSGLEVKGIEAVAKGLLRESNYETGIWDHEDLYDCDLIAFGRELKRAGKPQFFHQIRFKTLTAAQITDRMRNSYQIEGDEYADQEDRLGIIGKFIDRVRIGKLGDETDMLAEPRFNLNELTRADLIKIANDREFKMTFECFANLYLMCNS